MALRSLGSSLVAKSTPGSATRDLLEKQISKPAIPGKGEIGTTNRDLAAEIQVNPAAPGSEKIVSAGPGIEGSQVISPTDAAPTQPMQPLLAGGMGLSQGPGQAGSNNMAMMDGNANRVAASAPTTGGRTASARSGGPVAGSSIAGGNISVPGISTSVQAEAPKEEVGSFFSGISSFGGNRAAAGGSGEGVKPAKNLGQAIVATLSPAGSKGEAWGTSEAVRKSGVGSVTAPLKAISNYVGSIGPGKTSAPLGDVAKNLLRSITQGISTAKSNVSSKLRSLFKK